MDRQVRLSNASISSNGDVFEPPSSNNAKQRVNLIEWLNSTLPDLNLPINASDQELRAFLVDGTVLCRLLNKLRPGLVTESGSSISSPQSRSENVRKFLSSIDEMGLPKFQAVDLEKGSMKIVLDCLLTLQTQFMPNVGRNDSPRRKVFDERLVNGVSPRDRARSSPTFAEVLRGPLTTDPSGLMPHPGHKFHEVFQLKQGSYTDIPAAKITEMMKSNSLDNAPTQSLLSVVNGILDESIERKNAEIPHRVACLLRKVVQEIERRISTQAEHLRTQNNLFKAREEKYQSRIRVLEALATGTSEETQIVMNQLQQIKSEKSKIEEKKKIEGQESIKKNEGPNQEITSLKQELEVVRKMMKENNDHNQEVASLKKELEVAREKMKANDNHNQELVALKQDLVKKVEENSKHNQEIATLKQELESAKGKKSDDHTQEIASLKQELERANGKKNDDHNQEIASLKQEVEIAQRKTNDDRNQEITKLKQELDLARKKTDDDRVKEVTSLKEKLDTARKVHEQESLKMKDEAIRAQQELESRLNETISQLTESRKRTKELEVFKESKTEWWNKQESLYQAFTEFHLGALRELKFASQSIRQEIMKTDKRNSEEFITLGSKVMALDECAKGYHSLLSENQKMHNELQELKGNIRVYCRIRPFLPGQKGKQSCVEYVGENGELVVLNPSKQGKEGRRSFKFNKTYGPTTTQAEVFSDIQPLVQSVLDGYNVCIFAYGQTGSGKTYTMMGPNGSTEEDWGVNYRALNDLFRISQSREGNFKYEISVQMVEIYNEQVRDLLSSNDGPQKKIGILSTTNTNGLAVPDASINPVSGTSDVLKLMDTGLKNRAQASTSLNERSSRSHSVVSIHARGTDLKSGSTLRGSLHLVDLAGSERIDRSEVTGDRLKEAQHINKSLSALGDVIFALAQKNAHVPYRNSKLTQVLQSSLGGQAKTLMFVQLNPEGDSFSESISTLKFAERVSGVELGAAKSTKDGRDIRELMEQVASLKDTIAKKDEEIERLQEKRGANSLRYGPTSPSTNSKVGVTPERSLKLSSFKAPENNATSDPDEYSEGTEESSDHGSVLDEVKSPRTVEKTKSVARIPRTILKSARDSPKSATGLVKAAREATMSDLTRSTSGSSLAAKSPSRKWK